MSGITVVGGGPVGGVLALALAQRGIAVTVLEAREAPPAGDPRAIALAEGSRLILQRLGVWEPLIPHVTPIRSIHVSEQGRLGRTLMRATEMQRPALGYVVDYAALAGAVHGAMQAGAIEMRLGAAVTAVLPGADASAVCYTQAGACYEIQSKLAVLADGGRGLQTIAQWRRQTREYGQSALVARVTSEWPHDHIAYERFTPQGPLALLPWGDTHQSALVWTAPPARAAQLCGLDETEFLQQLHYQFGDRLGRFYAVSGRNVFPLKMAWVRPVTLARVVCIGNAAQTLHPVAGQGFNLGLRDAWQLARLIGADPQAAGGAAMLSAYAASRRLDSGGGMLFTDLLVRTFSNDLPGLGGLRGVGLGALELLSPLRHYLMRKMSFGARG